MYISEICSKCKSTYEIHRDTKRHRMINNLPNFCKDCMKIYKKENLPQNTDEYKKKASEKSKEQWKNMTDEEKDERKKKNQATWKSSGQDKKASDRVKNEWENMTEDEKKRRAEIVSKNSKIFWSNLSEEERKVQNDKISKGLLDYFNDNIVARELVSLRIKEYWENLSDEERNRRLENLSISGKNRWNNMSEEEKENVRNHLKDLREEFWRNDDNRYLLSEMMKDVWDSRPIEMRNYIIDKMQEGFRIWYDNLSEEELLGYRQKWWDWYNSLSDEIKMKNSLDRKAYWKNMTDEERLIWQKKRSEAQRNSNKDMKQTELTFMDILKINDIENIFQWTNEKKHCDFDSLFNNPDNIFGNQSYIHNWDFKIDLKNKSILVDIDGSHHFIPENKFIVNGFDVGLYHQWKDSQRPYQTDGLDAYVILCHNDRLGDNNSVLSLNTGKLIMFKEFMNELKWEMLSDKDKRKLLKEWLK